MGLMYKKVVFADSPLTLTAPIIDGGNSNQNSLVMDFDLTGGSVILNLPSINDLLFQVNSGEGSGAGAMSFYVKGNIIANAPPHLIAIVPAVGDTVCGSTRGGAVQGVGSCFHLFIAGRTAWGLILCSAIPPN